MCVLGAFVSLDQSTHFLTHCDLPSWPVGGLDYFPLLRLSASIFCATETFMLGGLSVSTSTYQHFNLLFVNLHEQQCRSITKSNNR
jgi:hypothetical protein